MRTVLTVLVVGSILWGGCHKAEDTTVEKRSNFRLPTEDKGPYHADRVTLPRYPGAVVENYEEAFAPGGKKVSFLRVYLNTTDPYDKVKAFYKKAFREKYGEPTEEGESDGMFHIAKARSKGATPYFQVEVTDMGDYRRIVITRSDGER